MYGGGHGRVRATGKRVSLTGVNTSVDVIRPEEVVYRFNKKGETDS